jgi:hypothetical protein
MIVQRVFIRVKPGHLGEFWELSNGHQKRRPDLPTFRATKRTYSANIGPSGHTVCYEAEFEDLAELSRAWSTWWADPGTPAYMEKLWSLVDDSHNEVWDLQE